MRGLLGLLCVLSLSCLVVPGTVRADVGRRPLVLSGEALTVADIIEVARQGRPVEIAPKARARVATTLRLFWRRRGRSCRCMDLPPVSAGTRTRIR